MATTSLRPSLWTEMPGLKDAAAPGEDVALEFSGVDMSVEVMVWCSPILEGWLGAAKPCFRTRLQNMVSAYISACFSQCWAQREAFRTGQKSLDYSYAHNILASKLFAPSMWFREVISGSDLLPWTTGQQLDFINRFAGMFVYIYVYII